MSMAGNAEYGKLQRVALRSPAVAFQSQDILHTTWRKLNYLGEPDYKASLQQFDKLVKALSIRNIAVDLLPGAPALGPDAIFVRDPIAIVDGGIITCSMEKPSRRGEPEVNAAQLRLLGLPQIGEVSAPARLE